jgi:DNA-directed RNA polymerase specialized sigma24 family protein
LRGQAGSAAGVALSEHGAELFGFLIGALDDADRARLVYAEVRRRAEVEIDRFSARCSARVWLYTIARAELASRRRHKPRGPAPGRAPELVAGSQASPARLLAVDALRRSLAEEDRELLILRVDRRLAWRDIARTGLGDDASDDAIEDETRAIKERVAALFRQLHRAAGSMV